MRVLSPAATMIAEVNLSDILYLLQRLLEIRDDILGILDTDGQTHHVRRDAGFDQLLIGELTMGRGRGMEHAGAGVGDMDDDLRELERFHKAYSALFAALEANRDNAAGAVGHILLRNVVILIGFQPRIIDGLDLVMVLKELGGGLRVGAMARHSQRQCVQTEVKQERVLRRLLRAEVTHEVGTALGDVRRLAELVGIDNAVIGLVGRGEHREIAACPVKVAGIDNDAAQRDSVTVHVLGGRMNDDVGAPFKGTAVDRGREGVVHDQRDMMRVSDLSEHFDIDNIQRGIGDGLDEYRLGVGLKHLVKLLGSDHGADKIERDTEITQGLVEKIDTNLSGFTFQELEDFTDLVLDAAVGMDAVPWDGATPAAEWRGEVRRCFSARLLKVKPRGLFAAAQCLAVVFATPFVVDTDTGMNVPVAPDGRFLDVVMGCVRAAFARFKVRGRHVVTLGCGLEWGGDPSVWATENGKNNVDSSVDCGHVRY